MCKTCGNTVDFVGKSGVLFRDFCSVKCTQVNKEVQQKKAETDKSHHNGKRGWNFRNQNRIDNREKTILQRYGDYSKALNIEKRKQTCLQKYGCANAMSVPEIQKKRNKTLIKQNVKYGTSNTEKEAFKKLKEIYPDILFHYTSKDYPWNCDFYVASEDLYIEYHGFYYHNGKPFEGTHEDIYKVEKLKEKSELLHKKWNVDINIKIYPDTILYVWTDLDVRKRNHCKEHNINYLEFYSLKEVEEYIKEMKENI